MNSQPGHSWTLAVAPAGTMLLSLSYISRGLFSVLESPACQGHSSDARVQRLGAPQWWGHERPSFWSLTGHVAGTSLPQLCYVLESLIMEVG